MVSYIFSIALREIFHFRISHDETDFTKLRNDLENSTKPKDNPIILKYIKNQIRELFHIPIAALIKGAAILSEDLFIDILPAAWELLLETNQETAASASALFIIASVRAPNSASDVMLRALKHKNPNIRIGAILRYSHEILIYINS